MSLRHACAAVGLVLFCGAFGPLDCLKKKADEARPEDPCKKVQSHFHATTQKFASASKGGAWFDALCDVWTEAEAIPDTCASFRQEVLTFLSNQNLPSREAACDPCMNIPEECY